MYNKKLISVIDRLGIVKPVSTISRDLNKNKGSVSSYLNGKIKASGPFLEAFAAFYKVSLSDISDTAGAFRDILREPSINYLNEEDLVYAAINERSDELVAMITGSTDLEKSQKWATELHELIKKLIEKCKIKDEKVVEGFEKYQNLVNTIKSNLP